MLPDSDTATSHMKLYQWNFASAVSAKANLSSILLVDCDMFENTAEVFSCLRTSIGVVVAASLTSGKIEVQLAIFQDWHQCLEFLALSLSVKEHKAIWTVKTCVI